MKVWLWHDDESTIYKKKKLLCFCSFLLVVLHNILIHFHIIEYVLNLIYFYVIVFHFNAINNEIQFIFEEREDFFSWICHAFCSVVYHVLSYYRRLLFFFSIYCTCCFQNARVDFCPLEFSRCYSGAKSGQSNAYGPVRSWELGNGSLGLRFQTTATATDEPDSSVEKFEYQAEVCTGSYLYCVAC